MKRVVGPKPEGTSDEISKPTPEQQHEQPHQQQPTTPEPRPMPGGRTLLPPELMSVITPSLQVGAGFGAAGLFTGAVTGIVRTTPPLLTSLFTGVQWFVLSSSYMGARKTGLKLYGGDDQEVRPIDKLKVSTAAGGFAGMVGGAIRARSTNIVYGTLAWSLYGGAGQFLVNTLGLSFGQGTKAQSSETSKGILGSKYSPLTFLSDKEYETILEEKVLRLEAEIAVVDDNIKELRDQEAKKRLSSGTKQEPKGINSER